MSSQFKARVARSSDYKRIIELCKLAVGSDDYAIPRMRQVIAMKGLFLAFCGSELVGISNFSRTIDGVGWYGMVRTHPDWRRKGIAIFLQRVKAKHARKLGIRKVRLFVLSTNTPSLRASLKGGFRPVSEAAHLTLSVPAKSSLGKNLETRNFSKESIKNILDSNYFKKMNGFIGYDSIFVKSNERVLEMISNKGEIYSAGSSTFILNQRDKLELGKHREFTILSGHFEKGLDSVAHLASKLGTETIGTFIPYDYYLIRLARNFGFKDDPWGWHCICFEKKV